MRNATTPRAHQAGKQLPGWASGLTDNIGLELDGGQAAQLGVLSAVNDTHPAAPSFSRTR